MGFHITDMQLNVLFQTWQTNYHIYAPHNFSGGGRFSDTDCIRYGKIEHADEIVFDKKFLQGSADTRFSNPVLLYGRANQRSRFSPKRRSHFLA